MADRRHDILKELLFLVSETPVADRAELMRRLAQEQPDLIDELRSLLSGVDEADESVLGPEETVPPASIGRYRVERLLARGGMGEVYLGFEPPPLSRAVAVKVIRRGFVSRSMVRRFELEREMLRSLDHPNIARICDGGRTGEGLPFLVIEYVEGLSLLEFVAEERVSLLGRLELMKQICRGVGAAHLKGLVHRDLKPGNVLVARIGDEAVPKVIDFGVAKILDPARDVERGHTAAGFPIGTLEYMSPEQAQGALSAIDQRSDIYSLGVMLYELATGRTPRSRAQILEWAGPNLEDRLDREPVVPISNLLAERSVVGSADPGVLRRRLRELDWIVLKALATEPERRYQSVASLSEDLDRLIDGVAVRAAPPSRVYRARKFVRRNAVATVAVGLVIAGSLGIAATAVISGSRVRAALTETQAALEEKRAAFADADAATRFLADMIVSASPFESAHTTTVAEMIDASVGDIEESLADAPISRWRVRAMMADTYRARGDPERALALVEAAVKDAAIAWGPSSPAYAEALRVQGKVLQSLGRYEEARRVTQDSFGVFMLESHRNHSARLTAMTTLADLELQLGRVETSIGLHEESVATWGEFDPGSDGHLFAHILLADACAIAGRHEDARRTLAKAERVMLENNLDTPLNLMTFHKASSVVAAEAGEYAAALEHLRINHGYAVGWFGPDHPTSLEVLFETLDVERAHFPDWLRIEQKYRQILESVERGMDQPLQRARAHAGIGVALLRLSRPEEALTHLDRAIHDFSSERSEIAAARPEDVVSTRLHRAEALIMLRSFEAARRDLEIIQETATGPYVDEAKELATRLR